MTTAQQVIATSVVENRTVRLEEYDPVLFGELCLRCADDCDPCEEYGGGYLVFWGEVEGHEWRVIMRDESRS